MTIIWASGMNNESKFLIVFTSCALIHLNMDTFKGHFYQTNDNFAQKNESHFMSPLRKRWPSQLIKHLRNNNIVGFKSQLDSYLRNIVDLPCRPGFDNSLDGGDCLHGQYADDLAAN